MQHSCAIVVSWAKTNVLLIIENGLNLGVTYCYGIDLLGEKSPEKDCRWRPTFQHPECRVRVK